MENVSFNALMCLRHELLGHRFNGNSNVSVKLPRAFYSLSIAITAIRRNTSSIIFSNLKFNADRFWYLAMKY